MEQLLAPYPTCPARLSPEQIAQYRRDGYLAFLDVLTADEVVTARAALSALVQRVANDPHAVKKGQYWTPAGGRFGVMFEAGYVPGNLGDPDLELKVRKLMWFVDQHPHLGFLANHHPKIRGVMESILGEPLLFQDMALIKPPFIGSEKPWHQDDAYFAVTPLEAICGVWIALDEATVENGCMHVLPGEHQAGPKKHYHGRDCEIVDDRIDASRARAVPLPPGGALFFSGLLPHQTPPNASPERRRALQFHYRSRASQIVDRATYDRVFVEADGTPASCAAAS